MCTSKGEAGGGKDSLECFFPRRPSQEAVDTNANAALVRCGVLPGSCKGEAGLCFPVSFSDGLRHSHERAWLVPQQKIIETNSIFSAGCAS